MDQRIITKTDNQSPFELMTEEVKSIYAVAKDYLDGDPVTEKQELEVSTILTEIKEISKRERALFTETKKPHAKAAKAVDDKFNPLKKKLEDAKECIQTALTPLRLARDLARQAESEKLREEAEQKETEAQEKLHESKLNLSAREELTELHDDAKKLLAESKKRGRGATGLRRTKQVELIDMADAARHYYMDRNDEFSTVLITWAKQDANRGITDIPGFKLTEIKKAI